MQFLWLVSWEGEDENGNCCMMHDGFGSVARAEQKIKSEEGNIYEVFTEIGQGFDASCGVFAYMWYFDGNWILPLS